MVPCRAFGRGGEFGRDVSGTRGRASVLLCGTTGRCDGDIEGETGTMASVVVRQVRGRVGGDWAGWITSIGVVPLCVLTNRFSKRR